MLTATGICADCHHQDAAHLYMVGRCTAGDCQCGEYVRELDELRELRADLALRAGSVAIRAAYAFGDWPPARS
jgi:hypothetical protein